MSTAISRKTFPFLEKFSKKKTAFVSERQAVSLYGRWNDEGSRNEYILFRDGKLAHRFPPDNPPAFGGKNETVELGPNEVVVQVGMFRGKPAIPHVMGPLTAIIPLMNIPFGEAMRVFHKHTLDDDTPAEVLFDWFTEHGNEKGAAACQQFLCTTSERG